MLHALVGFLVDVACCRFNVGKYSKSKAEDRDLPSQSVPASLDTSDNYLATPGPGVSLLSQDSASLIADSVVSPSQTQSPTPVTPTYPVQTDYLPQ